MDNKVIGSGKLAGASASKSGDGSGPTGSSRSYPKGSGKPSLKAGGMNPMNQPCTDLYVGGVGKSG